MVSLESDVWEHDCMAWNVNVLILWCGGLWDLDLIKQQELANWVLACAAIENNAMANAEKMSFSLCLWAVNPEWLVNSETVILCWSCSSFWQQVKKWALYQRQRKTHFSTQKKEKSTLTTSHEEPWISCDCVQSKQNCKNSAKLLTLLRLIRKLAS